MPYWTVAVAFGLAYQLPKRKSHARETLAHMARMVEDYFKEEDDFDGAGRILAEREGAELAGVGAGSTGPPTNAPAAPSFTTKS